MINTNILQKNLLNLESAINEARFNQTQSDRLTGILIKNYLDDDIPNDTDHWLMFAAKHDDIFALVHAINQYNILNRPVINKVESKYEELCKEVADNE